MRHLLPVLLLAACGRGAEPDPDWRHYADRLGDPIDGLDAATLAAFERGSEVMARRFGPSTGLGPSFNADSCDSCHGVPIPGGSAPHYRDFFLVKKPRWDGAIEDAGTNGRSPVRNLYTLHDGHVVHVAEPTDATTYARRNAPAMFGVGLFELVSDAHILSRADPDDIDNDGISGEANYEQARVGRFGYKSQASNVESFNRGAMLNQMGLTSNPLFWMPPAEPVQSAALDPRDLLELVAPASAWAQVSAPGEPTTDDDGVPDPELSDPDQYDLLQFSVFLAPPRPAARTAATRAGARHFDQVGCTDCHVPTLESSIGDLPAYTDLLVHDLGPDNGDGLSVGFASGDEFRTAPLWGVAITAPYLHDGSAETLRDAIAAHGGEAEASRDAFDALDDDAQEELIGFLESLGPYVAERPGLLTPPDAIPQHEAAPTADDVGLPGGPSRVLSDGERQQWLRGQALFDRNVRPTEGLGTDFNGDSCRACHQDPVLGGAGGIDTNVLRFGGIDPDGHYTFLGMNALPRGTVPGERPVRLPDEAAIVEARQPPTTLGVGAIAGISEAAILANADPTDLDGDGISGRARFTEGGQLGRFGWKAQIPSLYDFAADALLNELGQTLPLSSSAFTGEDDDGVPDPELPQSAGADLAFYMALLTPPARTPAADPARAERGAAVFDELGCAACHPAELDGVPLYSDLLLHDIASVFDPLVSQDPGVEPTEFRTPPLWGLADTAPYLHGGRAETPIDAVLLGHFGEGEASRLALEEASEADVDALRAFLDTL